MASAPPHYVAKAAFNTIFYKILPSSPDPAADLTWFGLPPDYIRYAGTHAFQPGGPCEDGEWLAAFRERVGPLSIATFWLRSPLRFFRAARDDINTDLPEIRPRNLGNVSRDSGLPPGAKLPSWTGWSALKTAAFSAFPALVVIPVVLTAYFGIRSREFGAVLLVPVSAAALELLVAVAFDAIETNRHLILFHWLVDLLTLLVVLSAIGARRRARAALAPMRPL